VLNTRVAGTAV